MVANFILNYVCLVLIPVGSPLIILTTSKLSSSSECKQYSVLSVKISFMPSLDIFGFAVM